MKSILIWADRAIGWLTFRDARRKHREFCNEVDANIKRVEQSLASRRPMKIRCVRCKELFDSPVNPKHFTDEEVASQSPVNYALSCPHCGHWCMVTLKEAYHRAAETYVIT